jgi:hypothetical protein
MGVNSSNVWKAIDSGGGQREIIAMNNRQNPTLGLTLGKEVQEQLELDQGDTVFLEVEEAENCLKIHLPPEE